MSQAQCAARRLRFACLTESLPRLALLRVVSLAVMAMVPSGRRVAVGQVVVWEEGSGVVDTAEVECSACVSAEV